MKVYLKTTILIFLVILCVAGLAFAQEDTVITTETSETGDLILDISDEKPMGEENHIPEPRMVDTTQNNMIPVDQPLTFTLGGGMSLVSWSSHVKVPGVNSKARYSISRSVFFTGFAQTEYKRFRLRLRYLKNRFKEEFDGDEEDPGQIKRDATTYILGEFEYFGPYIDSESFRFSFERSRIRGSAEYKLSGIVVGNEEFKTDYERYEALFIAFSGSYIGFDYERYAMPAVIGFKDSTNSVVYTDYDSDLVLRNITLLFGHDAIAKTNREKTDYNAPYLSGNFGIGIGWLDISDQLEKNAKSITGKTHILTGALMYKAMLELGYYYKKEPDTERDIGYSLNIGYRADYRYYDPANTMFIAKLLAIIFLDADPDELPEDEPPKSNELELEFRRHDFIHGPFIEAGVTF